MTEYSGTKPPHPAHKEVLVLNLEGQHLPFSMQVSIPTYEFYAHLQQKPDLPINIINKIEDMDEMFRIKMLDSIKEWERRTKEELEAFDRHDEAKVLAASIFD